jgi:alpha-beta hydrolase superfamily lysophospholipase
MPGYNPNITAQISKAIFSPRPDVAFKTPDIQVQDYFFKVAPGFHLRLRIYLAGKNDPSILFFHGNGETCWDYDPIACEFLSLPASFLVAEYRGYGPCGGIPSLDTFLEDAHLCLDQAKNFLASSNRSTSIFVMGRSLGSGPAIELAHARANELDGLIVESGFARTLPLLRQLGIPVVRLGLGEDAGPGNLSKMEAIEMPTLIMHAEQDQVINVEEARLLFHACRDPQKRLFIVPGVGHNDIQAGAGRKYFTHIKNLLTRKP